MKQIFSQLSSDARITTLILFSCDAIYFIESFASPWRVLADFAPGKQLYVWEKYLTQ